MGDRSGMSISADSPSDETLNRGLLALLLRRQYEFPSGINIVQFSFSFSLSSSGGWDIHLSSSRGSDIHLSSSGGSDSIRVPCSDVG